MRQLLNIKYDVERSKGSYSLNRDASKNCHLLVSDNWSQIRKKEDRFIYYLSSIWYDHSVGVSNLLWNIALRMPDINFYLKLVEDEADLNSLVPRDLFFQHLPLVIFVDKTKVELISSGPISEAELERRISELLI